MNGYDSGQWKRYGQPDPVFTYRLTSGTLLGDDMLVGQLSRQAGENTGEYDIGPGTLTAGGNYSLTFVGERFVILRAPLTVAADPLTKAYGAAIPELTATFSGWVNGDTTASLSAPPVLTTTAEADSEPGVYPIHVSGARSPNYDVAFIDGTLQIEVHVPAAVRFLPAQSRMRSEGFELRFEGRASGTYRVEASGDWIEWRVLGRMTSAGSGGGVSVFIFIDTESLLWGHRVYRVVSE